MDQNSLSKTLQQCLKYLFSKSRRFVSCCFTYCWLGWGSAQAQGSCVLWTHRSLLCGSILGSGTYIGGLDSIGVHVTIGNLHVRWLRGSEYSFGSFIFDLIIFFLIIFLSVANCRTQVFVLCRSDLRGWGGWNDEDNALWTWTSEEGPSVWPSSSSLTTRGPSACGPCESRTTRSRFLCYWW